MQCVELLIGGRSIPAQGGATFDRIDAFTGEVASRYAAATLEDADAAERSVVGHCSLPFPLGGTSFPPIVAQSAT